MHFCHEMDAESPRNRFCTAASCLALATTQLAYEPRMSVVCAISNKIARGRWEMGGVVQKE
jgi:hypothetical protein